MKILIRMSFKNILILALLILAGCSDSLEDSDRYIENVELDPPQIESRMGGDDNPIGCDIPVGSIAYTIEYNDGVSAEQRDLIRASFDPGYLICVQTDYCSRNSNIEHWVVRGKCPVGLMCRPLVSTPNFPDLKTAFAICMY